MGVAVAALWTSALCFLLQHWPGLKKIAKNLGQARGKQLLALMLRLPVLKKFNQIEQEEKTLLIYIQSEVAVAGAAQVAPGCVAPLRSTWVFCKGGDGAFSPCPVKYSLGASPPYAVCAHKHPAHRGGNQGGAGWDSKHPAALLPTRQHLPAPCHGFPTAQAASGVVLGGDALRYLQRQQQVFWLEVGLAPPQPRMSSCAPGLGASTLGRTRVRTVIKPQEKGADAGLGEQPGSRHPALGAWLAKSLSAESWPARSTCAHPCAASPQWVSFFSQTLSSIFRPCKDTSAKLRWRIWLQNHRALLSPCLMPATLLPALDKSPAKKRSSEDKQDMREPPGPRERKATAHTPCAFPVALAVEHAGTQVNAAARCSCCCVLDLSSQEGKITTRGSEENGGSAGTMRLLGHKNQIQALVADSAVHAATQAHCCIFSQMFDTGTGPRWICLGSILHNSLSWMLCSNCL